MGRIPEPHEIADAYFAERDEWRKAELEDGTCGSCSFYEPAPYKWCKVQHGWCTKYDIFTERDESAVECEEGYEAR